MVTVTVVELVTEEGHSINTPTSQRRDDDRGIKSLINAADVCHAMHAVMGTGNDSDLQHHGRKRIRELSSEEIATEEAKKIKKAKPISNLIGRLDKLQSYDSENIIENGIYFMWEQLGSPKSKKMRSLQRDADKPTRSFLKFMIFSSDVCYQ